ncbi:MAG: hypothetical protein ACERLM_03965, partial [Acidimicrobiales bacterium]
GCSHFGLVHVRDVIEFVLVLDGEEYKSYGDALSEGVQAYSDYGSPGEWTAEDIFEVPGPSGWNTAIHIGPDWIPEHESLVIGDELAVVASAPAPHRRAQLAAIEPRVRQVESLAQRLAVAANPPQTTPGLVPEPEGLDRLAEALDAMEAARQEVDQAERGETGFR